jgi:O-antigen ligase
VTSLRAPPSLRFLPESTAARRLPTLDSPVVAQLSLAALGSVAVGAGLAVTGEWQLLVAVLAGVALFALGLLRPATFLAVFILIRPVLAVVSNGNVAQGVASSNADGAIALLLLAVAIVCLSGMRSVHFPRATVAFGLVLVLSAGAAIYAFDTLGSTVRLDPVSELVRLSAELAIYVLAANLLATPARLRRLFALVALSAVGPAIIGLTQWISGPAYVPELGLARISSTFGGGPNQFAAYMALSALLLVGLPELLPRWVRLPSLVLILAALVGTYSREGWAMFLLGSLLIGWRRRPALVVAVIAVSVAIVALVPAVQSRVVPLSTSPAGSAQAPDTYASFGWRLDTWRILLDKWEQRPLIGYGLRSTQYVNPRRLGVTGGPSSGFLAHNSAVQILVEGGVLLMIGYLVLLWILLAGIRRMSRARWELRAFAALLLTLWVTVIVAGLTSDDTLGETTLMYAILAMTGSLEGAFRASRSVSPAVRDPLIAH